MLVKAVNVLRGPNYWSADHHQLIVLNIETEEHDRKFSSEAFKRNASTVFRSKFPSYNDAACIVKDIAVFLQKKAATPVPICHSIPGNKPGHYYIIFSYTVSEAGEFAAEHAVNIFNALRDDVDVNVDDIIAELKRIKTSYALGPSTCSIYDEAVKRNIPVLRLDNNSYLQLGYGAAQKRVEATITGNTGSIAVDKAGNKHDTKQLLTDACIPVPKGEVIRNVDNLDDVINSIGFPLVIKPLDGNQGKGATIKITTASEAAEAFARAKLYSDKVVIEQFIEGNDFRVLIINGKFVAAARRKPASVTGNGKNTIAELVEQVNRDPKRGDGHTNVLTRITLTENTLKLLHKKGLDLSSTPAPGEEIFLSATANLSTGGTAEDVTDEVHPSNIALCQRVARIIGLDVCGIDLQAPDLSSPLIENGGAIIEVNAAPGFRMHLAPTSGKPRNVAAPVLDMLFPDGNTGRIPIVAVTGTNGKTTTTRLIAQMVKQQGFVTGFTTTDGIYIDSDLLYKGDCSGPTSAKAILKDPAVEFAVFECARGGIIRSGLGFDQCDCAVVTNVASDHLGLNGIDTIEQLAKVKSVVAQSASASGYSVLNADDDLVYAMRDIVRSKVALFSLYADNYRIQQHCDAGGIAAVLDEGYVMLREGNRLIPIEAIENIPLSHNGLAKFNIANVLAATLASYLTGISLPAIRCSLRSFSNSVENTPGRMNKFDFESFSVLVDYAHNTHGLQALGEFIAAVPVAKKIGVITAVGDRRNEDIISMGEVAAHIFDEIVIRYDEDLRGRTEFEISSLLRIGIQRQAPQKKISYCAREIEALDHAVRIAPPNALIVLLAENVKSVCTVLKEMQNMKQNAMNGVRLAG